MEMLYYWVAVFVLIVVATILLMGPTDRVLRHLNGMIEDQIHEKVQDAEEDPEVIEGKYIGRAERLFFGTAVALQLPGFLTAMILWIGAKMATNWHRQEPSAEKRARSIGALILGITSLGVSLLVGLGLRMAVIHVPAILG